MRILFLTHSFNSLAQRLWCELSERGHQLSLEYDIGDAVAEEAVALWQPELIIAPYLKRAIPQSIWSRLLCLIVHPGIVGDRGPSALDWAIQEGATRWGVTLLEATAEMDAGPVWSSREFAMRGASKSSLYRNEVTEAALACVLDALQRFPDYTAGRWQPQPLSELRDALGRQRPLMRQSDRAIDWQRDDCASLLRKLHAADGAPGLQASLMGVPCKLYDARPESCAVDAAPGSVVARRDDALLLAARDGAVWIGQVQRLDRDDAIKLPAASALGEVCATLPQWPSDQGDGTELRYRESADGTVGLLSFDFYAGAMGTAQCRRLQAAIEAAKARPTRVLVLLGGEDFWSNGIDLRQIENSDSPADESMRNIEAMDDVCAALIDTPNQWVVAALQGNAGAGGVFLALTADELHARASVILNPHYKNMGNLYGSEYWTYLLPRRLGPDGASMMQQRLPITAAQARSKGLIDRVVSGDTAGFRTEVERYATALAQSPDLSERLQAKRARRSVDEAHKPLAAYRAEELTQMHRNFYGFDPSYHVARWHFVRKTPASWTPRHLALHRDPACQPRSAA
ncbi:hydrogenase maturation protein [Sinimarinibacterium sp. CAU 1509]|uniref:hydrogenase maturation protein n=1 Tax=Sinimarinibacterium sp. CAU 1509 TaxID=2562283 RepID=UPI0010AB6006|nr:hydrogenase maturation protein [Sinimarinibacterium sp. CAU 1509]TJY60034.1 hydrogenase maturation protein [Sinimarinibacterium sp. CAU 1509]